MGKMITSNSRRGVFDIVERGVVYKKIGKIHRNLAVSYQWIMNIIRIGMDSIYFDSELKLWCNSKAEYLKTSK